MFQEAPCTGADRRNCASGLKRAKLLLQKFLQSAADFVFFADEKVFSVASPDNQQNHRSTQNAICLRLLPYLLNICRKFEFLISQGSVATCLRWGGYCRTGFVANFIRFPVMQKFWKSVKIWQSYRQFKGGNFFETQCSYVRWWSKASFASVLSH